MEEENETTSLKESQDSMETILEMLRSYLVMIGPVLLSPENLDLRQTFASTLLIKESQDVLTQFIRGSDYPLLAVELLEDNIGKSTQSISISLHFI
jgi:hypothetical protein